MTEGQGIVSLEPRTSTEEMLGYDKKKVAEQMKSVIENYIATKDRFETVFMTSALSKEWKTPIDGMLHAGNGACRNVRYYLEEGDIPIVGSFHAVWSSYHATIRYTGLMQLILYLLGRR